MSDPIEGCQSETARPVTSKMITLRSGDLEEFDVPETVAKQSKTISYLRRNVVSMDYVPLPNVTASTLKMVIEYCKKHDVHEADVSKIETTEEGSSTTPASSTISDEELRNWDKQFVDVDQPMLYDLIMAANFLHIDGLRDLAIQKMAGKMKVKKIRQNLGIKTDFTPEDKEKMRRRYKRWLLYGGKY